MSPQGVKGYVVAPHEGRRPTGRAVPADAAGTENADRRGDSRDENQKRRDPLSLATRSSRRNLCSLAPRIADGNHSTGGHAFTRTRVSRAPRSSPHGRCADQSPGDRGHWRRAPHARPTTRFSSSSERASRNTWRARDSPACRRPGSSPSRWRRCCSRRTGRSRSWRSRAALAAYAIASRVEVEFPGFVAIPTEAIFVVMWFVLPPRMLPVAVCAAMLLGRLPDVLRGTMPPDRLALTVASCWYSVGPALVLYGAGVHSAALAGRADLPRGDRGAVRLRLRLDVRAHARGRPGLASAATSASTRHACGFDLVLAPLGLLAAFPAYRHPAALLLLMPMLLLVARLGREREQKNDKVLELKNAYQGTSYLLGDMIEADDAYTGSHSRDVVELVLGVADRLGLDCRRAAGWPSSRRSCTTSAR